MIYKFIAIKDPHLAFGFQNRIRKNYELHVTNKFNFIREYCLKNTISNIIFTGDVFDSSKEDKWSFKKYRKNKRFLEKFKETELELYSNVGNHDMFHGYEDADSTIFGEMVHDRILNNITTNPILIQEDGIELVIAGVDYSHDLEIVKQNIMKVNNGKGDYKVCVIHSNVTPNIVDRITDFTYKSLAEDYPNIDIFILGHYHVGYVTEELVRDNGKSVTFINNWNLTRVVRDYEVELDEHTPEFESVEIHFDIVSKTFRLITKTVSIPFVEYGETFHAKDIEIIKKSRQEILKFFETIDFEEIKNDSKKDDGALINQIKEKHAFSDESVTIALEYLNESKD